MQQDTSIKESSSLEDQSAYIKKLKQHFFQQEQHIEQLTGDLDLQKMKLNQETERSGIQMETVQIKNESLAREIADLKQV